jgi:hypothetical protein
LKGSASPYSGASSMQKPIGYSWSYWHAEQDIASLFGSHVLPVDAAPTHPASNDSGASPIVLLCSRSVPCMCGCASSLRALLCLFFPNLPGLFGDVTQTDGIHLVRFGVHNRTLRPCLAAIDRILIPVMACAGVNLWRNSPATVALARAWDAQRGKTSKWDQDALQVGGSQWRTA